MPELTAKESPIRLFLSESKGRLIVSHPDYLLVVCLSCGGTKSLLLHKTPGLCSIPSVFECICKPPVVYPIASFESETPHA